MTDSKYRKTFDLLANEIEANLVDTHTQRERIDEAAKTYVYIPTVRSDGSTDFAILPRVSQMNNEGSQVPRSAEPIAFSKILVAASAIASNLPDGTAVSINRIKARFYYELWKRSWTVSEMNGFTTLETSVQNLLTYGWTAWRVFPKQIIVDKTVKKGDSKVKSKKIIFDDIYREPLDPRRTWFGLSYKAYNNDNRPEVLYEIDITKEAYETLKKTKNKRKRKDADTGDVSIEGLKENPEKQNTHVTITFYENPKENRCIVSSDSIVFYDGEMPNEDVYGSVVFAHCFFKDMNDPHGVGLFEMMRGNAYLYNYINSLNAEQVESEIHPILFGMGMTGQGDLTYKRSPNYINPLPAGGKVEKVLTTGNTTLGINYANAQKKNLEDNTGVNDIVSGSNTGNTLGGTVILKEAALNRLIKPRNSIKQALENDSCILFSLIEQGQANAREFTFANPDEAKLFAQLNPEFQHSLGDLTFNEEGVPELKVFSSQKVPVTFDFSKEGLIESDFEDQEVDEFGDPKYTVSKETAFKTIREVEERVGYDRVLIKIDTNSMLVPSQEVKKQASMSIFPVIQNSIQIIYGLARQDAEQAVAQLKSLTQFLEIQKENIYDYIPKEQYDKIMTMQMAPSPEQQMMQMMQGQATQSDGTNVAQPQNPREMSQSRMDSSFNASMGKMNQEE